MKDAAQDQSINHRDAFYNLNSKEYLQMSQEGHVVSGNYSLVNSPQQCHNSVLWYDIIHFPSQYGNDQ